MFRLVSPSSDQVQALEDQFNEADASVDNGDGRSIVTRQGFLVTSEVPEGFDVGPDEFAVVEPRDGFPSVLILGQNSLIAPFIAGLEDIDFQQEIGEANSLFDQTRNGGGSNLSDVDPSDIDEVVDLFVGSDILDAGPDAGRVTAVDPSVEQFDAILENLEGDGGLTPGGFAVGPLPRALENVDNPDPNQIVLTPAGTTSDGQDVPPALFVENLRQVAVFQAALEEAGLDQADINNLVNNVFNPLRNDQLQAFDADAAADVSALFAGADVVNGGNIGINGDIDVGQDDDGAGNDDAGDNDVGDDGNDNGDGVVVNNAGGGAQFVRFDPNAEQLSVIREALETGDTAGISVDNFAVGEIPASLNDPSSALEVLITEGGVDAQGNEVPPSLLFDPAVLERQANIRIAAEEAFPDDAETRNLLQRQFDQVRNDNLSPFEVGDDVGDVTQIFDGLNLPALDGGAVVEDGDDADIDDQIVEQDGRGRDFVRLFDGDEPSDADERVIGSREDELIDAGGGDDVLDLRGGNDFAIGGEGEDRFVLARRNQANDDIGTILDFDSDDDTLIFRRLDGVNRDNVDISNVIGQDQNGDAVAGTNISANGQQIAFLSGVEADEIDVDDDIVFADTA